MRAIDTQIAFPGLLLALIILATVGPTIATVIIVLALNGWMVYARVTRGIVMSLRHVPFVEAAEIIGCRPRRVIFRHLLPNLTSPLLTLMMLEFARVVLAEASLSFLGLGVQPPASSWGLDVATGKAYIFNAWWLVTFPGLAIALTVLGDQSAGKLGPRDVGPAGTREALCPQASGTARAVDARCRGGSRTGARQPARYSRPRRSLSHPQRHRARRARDRPHDPAWRDARDRRRIRVWKERDGAGGDGSRQRAGRDRERRYSVERTFAARSLRADPTQRRSAARRSQSSSRTR